MKGAKDQWIWRGGAATTQSHRSGHVLRKASFNHTGAFREELEGAEILLPTDEDPRERGGNSGRRQVGGRRSHKTLRTGFMCTKGPKMRNNL